MSEARRIAVITGGSRGIGASAATSLALAGVDSVITYKSSPAAADQVVAGIKEAGGRAVALQLDTADISSFGPFADRLRKTLSHDWERESFDFLVNNAGNSLIKPFAETTEQDFDDVFDVHLKGVFFLTQTLTPLLTDGGAIVNLSTSLTRFTGAGQSVYATAKGAVEILTRYLAKELGDRQIAVNAFAPGPIATDFAGGAARDSGFRDVIAPQVALGRVGEPEDVGDAITALLTSRSHWITGQRIEVSGGTLL
ncbi:SDR family oxidoreductase [Streptomyces sp. NPDC026672]|uniref:SDR family oxidoreductase n=1 Tax=unclassified Streptomyces TaxID=2593676 RepID=UPI0033E8BA66